MLSERVLGLVYAVPIRIEPMPPGRPRFPTIILGKWKSKGGVSVPPPPGLLKRNLVPVRGKVRVRPASKTSGRPGLASKAPRIARISTSARPGSNPGAPGVIKRLDKHSVLDVKRKTSNDTVVHYIRDALPPGIGRKAWIQFSKIHLHVYRDPATLMPTAIAQLGYYQMNGDADRDWAKDCTITAQLLEDGRVIATYTGAPITGYFDPRFYQITMKGRASKGTHRYTVVATASGPKCAGKFTYSTVLTVPSRPGY